MMNQDHIDPELLELLANRRALRLSVEKIQKSRDFIVQAAQAAKIDLDPAVKLDELHVTSRYGASSIRVLRYQPASTSSHTPVLLHCHAGGFVMGTPEMTEPENIRLVKELNCTIFSVDYRLAPEHPYPTALHDVYSVLSWLHDNAETLKIDKTRIGIKGESGGGGIAAGVAIFVRDTPGPKLAFQHLIYPMLDDRTVLRTDLHEHIGQVMWTNEHNRFGWQSLLGKEPGSADVSPYAAASRALDLRGLPPTFISVGALDLFCEENIVYAQRLLTQGVPVELHVYPRAFHGFRNATNSRVAKQAAHDSVEALRRSLYG
jgi:acetyl esterase/lipase